MSDTYPCPFPYCGKTFSKAFELKKHKVTHEDPDRVFYCPQCDFITLQKKNLRVHLAIHTGEKTHRCPDVIGFVAPFGLPADEDRCGYRTNDPAALTKHRKKVHGYIPSPNRSRPRKGAPISSRNARQKDRNVSQRLSPLSCPEPPRVPEGVNSASSGAEYSFTSIAAPEGSAPLLRQGNVDVCAQPMPLYSSNTSGYDSSISSSSIFTALEETMDLNALYDPSLQPDWMAKYSLGYGMFGMTGMKYLPQPLPAVLPPDPASLDMQIGREGYLCPEWMVEAGIEGWDQSMLDTDTLRQFYGFDA